MKMNGWTNRETWLVNLWNEYSTKEELEDIKFFIEEELESLQISDFMSDLLGVNFVMNEINWDELEGHCEAMEGLVDES
jgi:hypothetical protein